MKEENIIELELGEAETEREFFVGVRYYGGNKPYVSVYETIDQIGDAELVYKIRIPYKPTPSQA